MRAPNTVSSTCSLLLWWIHTLHWCWWGRWRWWSLLNHVCYYRNNLPDTIVVFFYKSQLIKKMVRMTIMLTKLILGGGGGRCWRLGDVGGFVWVGRGYCSHQSLIKRRLYVSGLRSMPCNFCTKWWHIDDKRISTTSKISAWRQHRTWL